MWSGRGIVLCQSVLTAAMGILGVFLTLMPPQTTRVKSAYAVAFIVLSCVSVWLSQRQGSFGEEARSHA